MLSKRSKMDPVERTVMGMDERFSLIDLVRSFPELWDERHVFKDQDKKTHAWSMIKAELEELYQKQFLETDIHRTFENLRDVYRRKRKKVRDVAARSTGSDASHSAALRIKALPFYEAVTFLDQSMDQGGRYCTAFEAAPAEEPTQPTQYDEDEDTDAEQISQQVQLGSQPLTRPSSQEGSRAVSRSGSQAAQVCTPSTSANIEPLSVVRRRTEGSRQEGCKRQDRGLVEEKVTTLKDTAQKADRIESAGLQVVARLRA
ncbi:hypothetical protein Q1695_003044 [Nippostrongylus brasiliensis]|nr:hypothetical protein Q1695_003044 [Nippostrongylus brasiliensis]